MEHHPAIWGRPRRDHLLQQQCSNNQIPLYLQHTQQPIVTGSSVLAVRYEGGVVMAADCLGNKRTFM